MKKLLLLLLISTIAVKARPQNVGIGTNTPNINAALDIESPTKGLLIPRITTEARNAITATKGLMVYDLNTNTFWFHTGTTWTEIITSSNTWSLSGNSNTNPANQFLGTTDNQPLRLRLNNINAGLFDHTTANYIIGYQAANQNTTATGIIAIGQRALNRNTDKSGLVAVGDSALFHNGTNAQSWWEASNNTAIGKKALYQNMNGYRNTAVGFQSLTNNQNGSHNTAVGNEVLFNNNTGQSNTGVGNWVLFQNQTGSSNTAVGGSAMYWNTTGIQNSAYGAGALYQNTKGKYNTSIGGNTLSFNDTGHYNTAVGYEAMRQGQYGTENTAIGYRAMHTNGGEENSALGMESLYNNFQGDFNTAVGTRAMHMNGSGSYNTAVGYEALYTNNFSNNTAIGTYALRNLSQGHHNTAIGYEAQLDNTIGWNNTAVGMRALLNNETGDLRTGVGRDANSTGAAFNNNTGIGYAANCTASDQVRIGNTSVTSIGGVVGWTTVSDARFKSNEKTDVKGLAFINALKPVSYNINVAELDNFMKKNYDKTVERTWKTKYDIQKIRFTGFNAQEVEALARQLGFEFSGIDAPKNEGDYYGLRYGDFVVPLVKAVQEQQAIIDNLQRQIDELKRMINK